MLPSPVLKFNTVRERERHGVQGDAEGEEHQDVPQAGGQEEEAAVGRGQEEGGTTRERSQGGKAQGQLVQEPVTRDSFFRTPSGLYLAVSSRHRLVTKKKKKGAPGIHGRRVEFFCQRGRAPFLWRGGRGGKRGKILDFGRVMLFWWWWGGEGGGTGPSRAK